MDKNDINNIIKSELVARTNNTKIRQEYGEQGTHPNVTVANNITEFKTVYKIVDVIYVTVDGVMQTAGINYNVVGDRVIRFTNIGGVRTNNPFIQVGFQFDKTLEATGVRPFINMFDI